MSRFSHDWTKSPFRVFADPPPGSQVIATGGNGGDGGAGDKGSPGDHNTPPGQGGLGGLGGLGGSAFVDGSGLTFSKPHPIGDWLASATGGHGGRGGNGGDAGTFPPHHEYGVSWPGGGSGGDGGDGASGEATINNVTIYGRTGTGAANGIGLSVEAIGGFGGRGGNGGNADGKNGSPSSGGAGGSGGDGGNGSGANAHMVNVEFDRTNNAADPNHFVVALHLSSHAGNGGRGGDGGAGGKGTPAGDDGSGGDGGDGGGAVGTLDNIRFDMAHGGGGSSLLSIVMDVRGGNGGNGGAAGGPFGATGLGGSGGDADITFVDSVIQGGGEDDTVRLAINARAGEGGVSGDGTLHTTNGSGGAFVSGNTIAGGGGHNALLFSWAGGDTNLSVFVHLSSTKMSIDGGASISSVTGFQDVTGGSRDDDLGGDDAVNKLNGAGGDDSLQGGVGADTLTGGGGHDHFVFIAANESTGATRDTITDLNFNQDAIGLDFDITHVDAAIGGATISKVSFNHDLHAAVGNLKSEHAVLVTATHGTLHDHVFLVIDVDGVKGYQGGSDIVIDVTGMTGTMTAHDFFNAH